MLMYEGLTCSLIHGLKALAIPTWIGTEIMMDIEIRTRFLKNKLNTHENARLIQSGFFCPFLSKFTQTTYRLMQSIDRQ